MGDGQDACVIVIVCLPCPFLPLTEIQFVMIFIILSLTVV